MKRKLFAISLAAVLLLAGCGGGSKSLANSGGGAPASSVAESEGWSGNGAWDVPMGATDADFAPEEPAPGAPADTGSTVYQRPDAKLIRRATLEIQTEQFDQSMEALNKLVDSCGGYIENSNLYGGGRLDAYASRNAPINVREPAF